jgi:hypothetical protein
VDLLHSSCLCIILIFVLILVLVLALRAFLFQSSSHHFRLLFDVAQLYIFSKCHPSMPPYFSWFFYHCAGSQATATG